VYPYEKYKQITSNISLLNVERNNRGAGANRNNNATNS
jgi:hypothetical protein